MLVTPITKLLNIRVQVSFLTFTPGIYTHVQAKLDLLCREVCSGKCWVTLRTVKVRQTCRSRVGVPSLAAAVSNAGGLGMLPSLGRSETYSHYVDVPPQVCLRR